MPQLAREFGGPGTFFVAEWGWQDATDYALIVGSREAILNDDSSFIAVDDQQVYVDRQSGSLRRVIALDNLWRDWQEVGKWDEAPLWGDDT